MSYQQGYPPQSQGFHQQPQGFHQPEPLPPSRTNPATAVISALLGLAAAAALVVLVVDVFGSLPDQVGFADLAGDAKTILILRAAAALVLVIAAIIMLVRKLAGAIIMVLGALAGIAAILLLPILSEVEIPFGTYLEAIFQFEDTQSIFSAVALIAAPLALIFAILPPTLHHLKGTRSVDGGYPQQPEYPQQPDYPQQQSW